MDARWLQTLNRTLEQMERRCVDRYNSLVGPHNVVAKQVVEIIHAQRVNPARTIDNQRALHAAVTEAARNYTNLVMLGGYAGLFGLWQMARPQLSSHSNALVGTGISISLMLFAGFEIYKMINEAWHSHQLESLLRSEKDFTDEERVAAWNIFVQESQRRVSRIWVWVLIPTVLTGFGSGFYLLGELISSLWS